MLLAPRRPPASARPVTLPQQKEEANWSAVLVAFKHHKEAALEVLVDSIPDDGFAEGADGPGVTPLMGLAVAGRAARLERLAKEGLVGDLDQRDNNHETALFKAVAAGKAETVRVLLKLAATPMRPTHRGITPLMQASVEGQTDMARLLLGSEHVGDINATDADNETALLKAAWKGHAEIIRLLLSKGADPGIKTRSGWTPLMFAARDKCTEVVELILGSAAGGPVDAVPSDGETALFKAVAGGHTAGIRLLLDAGADPSYATRKRITPLMQASFVGNALALEILLATGRAGDVNATDADNETALLKAAWKGHAEIIRLLLSKGADPSIATKTKWTPLMFAARDGHRNTVSVLLRSGKAGSVDAGDRKGVTALRKAVVAGHTSIVRALLVAGARIDAHEPDGQTLLMMAALHGHTDVAHVLLEVGHAVDLDAVDKDEETALLKAAWKGHAEVVRLLLSKGADAARGAKQGWTPLMLACVEDREDAFHVLLSSGSAGDVDATDKDGETALVKAAWKGRSAMAGRLLDAGADPNHVAKNGATSLVFAARHGRSDAVSLLLRRGAKSTVNAVADDVGPAIADAAKTCPLEVVAKLLVAKADPNIQRQTAEGSPGMEDEAKALAGRTALFEAAIKGRPAVVELLLAHFADPLLCNALGQTPFDAASMAGQESTASILDVVQKKAVRWRRRHCLCQWRWALAEQAAARATLSGGRPELERAA